MMIFEKGKKQFAVLIDPDKTELPKLITLLKTSEKHTDFYLVGGSLLLKNNLEETIISIKKQQIK